MFKVTIEGVESLEKEFTDEFMPRVNKAVTAGLKVVGNDLTASLQQHIQTDVYAAYTPKAYQRRGSQGGMLDRQNFDASVKGHTLRFNYKFDTDTPVYADEDGVVTHEWRSFADSDDAIRAIQDGRHYPTVGTLTDKKKIVQRPFWDNFAIEQLVDGKVEISLAKGMNEYDNNLGVTADRNIKLDGKDSDDLHGSPEHGYRG